jgi:hypothetical protein
MNAGGTLPEWNAVALNQSGAVSGALGEVNGGTGQNTYTLGDTLYSSAANTIAKLAGNTTTTKKFLAQTGTGSVSAAPAWDTISGSDVSGNISGQAGSVANALTAGSFLTSGGTFDGSAARTFAVDATDANTASKVVARDASGNFSAGTITATLSGSATSATTATNLAGGAANRIAYQTGSGTTSFTVAPSASNQVLNWNGSAFTWSAGTISGIPLGSNLNALTLGSYLTGTSYNGSGAVTAAVDATSANTASKVVARDASGNFSAGTITAALTGTASGNLPLSGGTLTGNLIFANATSPNTNYIQFGDNTGWNFRIMTNVSGTPTVRYTFADNGNFTAVGNVTAYSDERLKKDWKPVAEDFVDRLANVKHGSYTRTDSEERQAGVSAQDWQKLLGETVQTDADGFLSVAYGNAALVAAVKLAERVVALEARIAALEAKG